MVVARIIPLSPPFHANRSMNELLWKIVLDASPLIAAECSREDDTCALLSGAGKCSRLSG